MVKKLSCVSCGSLKGFPHTFTTPTLMGYSAMQDNNLFVTITSPLASSQPRRHITQWCGVKGTEVDQSCFNDPVKWIKARASEPPS